MDTTGSRGFLTLTAGAALLTSLIAMLPSAFAKTHEVSMTAVETDIVIDGSGEKYAAWTFNGTVPGPVVRVTEGDTVKFTLTNPATNKYPHAMDFHAAEIDFLKNEAGALKRTLEGIDARIKELAGEGA